MIWKRSTAKGVKRPVSSESEKFLWHLLQPWVEKYSHQHWWGEAAQGVELEAAIWEILRRHPDTEWFLISDFLDPESNPTDANWSPREQFLKENLDVYWQQHRKKFYKKFYYDPVYKEFYYDLHRREKEIDLTLGCYALRSWVELPKKEQKRWKGDLFELDPQHGHCPNLSYLVDILPDIDYMRKEVIAELRVAAKRHHSTGGKDESLRKILNEEVGENALIKGFAEGQIFIGFDPCVPNIEKLVLERVRASVRKWRRLFPKSHVKSHDLRSAGRARVAQWLDIIKRFEEAELSRCDRTKRGDQLFARYRRTIGGWIL